jgi:phosphatidylglycerol:prolipoprotein diacylglycerol transferase
MFTSNFDPVAFTFLSLEIRWYSLAYIFGIIVGWIYCKKFLIKDKYIFNIFDDLITYLIIGIILGGRIGYILFYNFDYYLNNLNEIFMLWKGGMSFHGGLIGVLISTILFGKKHNINPLIFLDLISAVAPIGIFLGRIANFLNAELYGKETNLLWGVVFPKVDNFSRHPSQIYEALFEGLILFLILNLLIKKNLLQKPGIISSYFLILYSFFRFLLEFFREPDIQLGYLVFQMTMGQILSIFLFFIGIGLFLKKNEK